MRVSDVLWVVCTFCSAKELGRVVQTCRAFYEVVDDSVWRVLCKARFIENLPHHFASWGLYYRYASLGAGVIAGEVLSPFVSPLDGAVVQRGNIASVALSGTSYPVVRLVKTRKAAAILLTRPEHCHVGVTTSTTIRAVSRMWSPEHHLWALAFLLPGATLEFSIVDDEARGRSLVVERLGGVVEEVVLRERLPDGMAGKPVYFIVGLAANFASFAAIG